MGFQKLGYFIVFSHFTQPSSTEKAGSARGLFEPLQAASFAAPGFFEQRRVVCFQQAK
jgi:hypothetical protein